MVFKWFKKKKANDIIIEDESPQPQEASEHTEALPVSEDAEASDEETSASQPPRETFFRRLRNRMSRTRRAFANRIDDLLAGKKEIDEALLEELEEILITSDIGVQTTSALIADVRAKVDNKEITRPDEIQKAIQGEILNFLKTAARSIRLPVGKPHVMMVIGVNGVGKTTTIGKLGRRFIQEGKQVLLVAADTFRAAAVEQLQIWGDRIGAGVVRHGDKADPSAVVYDGIQAAMSRGADVVIIDTAGRLHTKVNLMEQLKKIRRTIARQIPDGPHETLLVLDATTGQNAISQAQLFHEALEVTGIVLTKLDGTAKGGIVVGISHSLNIPIRYVGIGETADDLQDFDADAFVGALF